MESLIIAGTQETPQINFDSTTGRFSIVGRSYPSDTAEFYQPINTWLNKFIVNHPPSIVLEINIEYFHSVSVKFLSNIIKKIIALESPTTTVSVIWYFEDDDDDNIDLGKSLERETKSQFTFMALEQE